MAITIPPAARDALGSWRIVLRTGIVFDFPSGIYAFWDGMGTYEWSGVDFAPGGRLLEVSEIPSSADLSSAPVTVKLRAIPDAGLTTDVLGTIEEEQYHQRPVTIYAFFFSADDGAYLAGIRVYAGYIDQIDHIDGPGDYHIEARLESRSRDHTRTGHRARSPADQDRVSAGDLFFQHVSTTSTIERKWGRA